MAFTPTSSLTENTNVVLRDQQHAARLFVDDQFRLAPKHKFLYHVSFGINPGALLSIDLLQRHRNEINMLVKACDLPNISPQVETVNQYNRVKNVQYRIKYNPLNITFHDDNMGVINQLWQNYYSYYYADSSSAADTLGAYNRNATKNFNYINNLYGLDNNSTDPFFKYIKIYQLARHEYVEYTIHNPIISGWNHNKLGSNETGLHDNLMTIQYEAVSYANGLVSDGTVEGFASEHYDQTPSPLQAGTPATTTSPTFTNNQNIQGNAGKFLSNITQTVNGYQNQPIDTRPVTNSSIANSTRTAQQGVSGLQGIAFPIAAVNNGLTVATGVKF
jgi:hypothetical protein